MRYVHITARTLEEHSLHMEEMLISTTSHLLPAKTVGPTPDSIMVPHGQSATGSYSETRILAPEEGDREDL